MSRSINLVPTWEAAAWIYATCLEDGDSASAKADAARALADMGRRIDWFNEHAPDDLKRKML